MARIMPEPGIPQLLPLRSRWNVPKTTRLAPLTKKACGARDAPTLRYKVALCMYSLGHGGPIKVLADAGSVGESSMRRYLGLFAVSVIQTLRPVYMPGTPGVHSQNPTWQPCKVSLPHAGDSQASVLQLMALTSPSGPRTGPSSWIIVSTSRDGLRY